jgi:hypothetical protein
MMPSAAAGVVDQRVDSRGRGPDLAGRPPHLGHQGEVGAYEIDSRPGRGGGANLGLCRSAAGRVAADADHMPTHAGQRDRRRLADSCAGSRHDRRAQFLSAHVACAAMLAEPSQQRHSVGRDLQRVDETRHRAIEDPRAGSERACDRVLEPMTLIERARTREAARPHDHDLGSLRRSSRCRAPRALHYAIARAPASVDDEDNRGAHLTRILWMAGLVATRAKPIK